MPLHLFGSKVLNKGVMVKKLFSISKILRALALSSLVFTVACGSDDDDSTNVVVNSEGPQREEEEDAPPVSSRPTIIINNKFETNIRMNVKKSTRIEKNTYFMHWECDNFDPVEHKQYIHAASSCPTLENDLNGDGYIDSLELEQAVGPGIVALDSHPESEGEDSFPVGSSYVYNASLSLSFLRQMIPDRQDFIVVLYGVDPSLELPETVSAHSEDEVHSSLPIACQSFKAPHGEEQERSHDRRINGETGVMSDM